MDMKQLQAGAEAIRDELQAATAAKGYADTRVQVKFGTVWDVDITVYRVRGREWTTLASVCADKPLDVVLGEVRQRIADLPYAVEWTDDLVAATLGIVEPVAPAIAAE